MVLFQNLSCSGRVLATAATLGLSVLAIDLPAHAASLIASDSIFAGGLDISDRSALDAANVSFLDVGVTRIYVGSRQVTPIDIDPFVVSFTGDTQNWGQVHDQSPIDSRGVGLLWDESSNFLYAAFTADGGSIGANTFGDVTNGWLDGFDGRNPSASGIAQVTVLLQLDLSTGEAVNGTYISAVGSGGAGSRSAFGLTNLAFGENGSVIVDLDRTFFIPRGADGLAIGEFDGTQSSPFEYRVELESDLSAAIDAIAVGWNGVTELPPLSAGNVGGGDPGNGGGDPGNGGGDPGTGGGDPGNGGGDPGSGGGDPGNGGGDPGTGGGDPGNGGGDPGNGGGDPGNGGGDPGTGGGDPGNGGGDPGNGGGGDPGNGGGDPGTGGGPGNGGGPGSGGGDPTKVPEPSVLGAIAALGGAGVLRKLRRRR